MLLIICYFSNLMQLFSKHFSKKWQGFQFWKFWDISCLFCFCFVFLVTRVTLTRYKENNKTRTTLDLVRALLNLLLILVVLPHLLDEVVLVDPMELWLLLLVLQLEGREGCRGCSVVGLSEGWGSCSWNGLIFSLLVVQGVPLQWEHFRFRFNIDQVWIISILCNVYF